MWWLFVAEPKYGRGRWGVEGAVGNDVCVGRLDVGKRVIVYVGSWQDCKMPITIMCTILSWRR